MKKNILIIVILFLTFFGIKNVYASEAVFSGAEDLNNISYVKYDGKYYYFRNAKAIRNVNTNNIAYCIEPFATLVDGSSYLGYIKYDSIFNLSKEQWERLKLLAYYGYGYKNHLDEKWITITQILIWRTVDPNHSFNWIDNVKDKNIIYPYGNEINEIESLITLHNVIPNIPVDIKMSIDSTIKFFDDNLVLSDYKIVKSDIDAKIEGDNLIINSSNIGDKTIVLEKNGDSSSSVEFFYKSGTQSVIERGNIDPVRLELKVTVESGSIKINKIDSDSKDNVPKGEASLAGAIYSVFDSENNLVGNISINDDCEGSLKELPYGKYMIKEIKAGTGYYLDRKEYFVDIDSNNLNIEITLENKVIDSRIKIIKHFGDKNQYDTNTMDLESGIKFEIYDTFEKLVFSGVTNEFGEIEVVLPYGRYVVKQINTTFDYEKVDDLEIVVNENSNVGIHIILNDLKVEVPDAYIEEGNSFYDGILLFILTVLLGVIYVVEDF